MPHNWMDEPPPDSLPINHMQKYSKGLEVFPTLIPQQFNHFPKGRTLGDLTIFFPFFFLSSTPQSHQRTNWNSHYCQQVTTSAYSVLFDLQDFFFNDVIIRYTVIPEFLFFTIKSEAFTASYVGFWKHQQKSNCSHVYYNSNYFVQKKGKNI